MPPRRLHAPARPPYEDAPTAAAAAGLLRALGVAPALADDLLGDVTEEYAERRVRDGAARARLWCAREVVRSAPHVAVSAARHGGPRERARLAACAAAPLLAVALAVAVALTRHGPPAMLVSGDGAPADGLVINGTRPVRLRVQVLDTKGRVLDAAGVRYAWRSGAPVTVSPAGDVTCTQRGDAVVRAAIGPVATELPVRCRPVREVRTTVFNDFVLGDPARELPVEFIGTDGGPVTLLSARLAVRDSTVATLEGLRIVPLRPGVTHLSLEVGERSAGGAVRVFAPVATLEGLRPDVRPWERFVAAPVRLVSGDTLRWVLPSGLFNLVFLPTAGGNRAAPAMQVEGRIMCLPRLGPRTYNARCLARGPGTTLTIAHPGRGKYEVTGSLALEWERPR